MNDLAPQHPQLNELIALLARLRAPGGCAWDREQTHESLAKHLIEETHELVEAIEVGTREELIEELGDVLYQVLFHADIATHAENTADRFTIDDVAENMTRKMVGRHPHVFASVDAATSADVMALWEKVKAIEKPSRTSVLDGIPDHLPSLQLADKVLGRAQTLGMTDIAPPAGEPSSARQPVGEAELGAQLLALVAKGRMHGLDSERALRSAIRQVRERVAAHESTARASVDVHAAPATRAENYAVDE